MSGDPLRPYDPDRDGRFDLRRAGHLARRGGFGAALAEREAMVAAGHEGALDRILRPGPGEDHDALLPDLLAVASTARVRAYRFLRLLAGRHRLRERMSYFWHGHFATGNQKVQSARLMARQLALFDRLGLGRFDELLRAVSRDPAMIRWLDSDRNVRGRPNENFARELFELFSLGRGAYSEDDVREAARAFTGWQERHERFAFAANRHDPGSKSVLGHRGRLGGDDVVAIAAAQPASARFLCRKWLAFFVHPQPTDAEVEALAAVYRAHDREVGPTLSVLLRSALFFGPRAYRSRVKSPVDLAVGTVRCLGASVAPLALARAAGKLGQVLLEPPSVEGWHGELAWITSATWLLRSNFAAALFAGRDGLGLRPAATDLLAAAAAPADRADLALRILLDDDVEAGGREAIRAFAASAAGRGDDGAAAILHAVQCLPEAQLL